MTHRHARAARTWVSSAVVALVGLTLVSCGDDDDGDGSAPETTEASGTTVGVGGSTADDTTTDDTSAATTADGTSAETAGGEDPYDLASVCPATVAIQIDWEPEAEHGPFYELLGDEYDIDTGQKRVSGPLVAGGQDTGVEIELRAGGSAIGFQSVPSEMYVDDDIYLGSVTTDSGISASGELPVTAVVAPLTWSPQILMWDPETYPDWETVADIGDAGAPVVVAPGGSFIELLLDQGSLQPSQIDESYDGSPARFAADTSIVQQGYATSEPYIYENEVDQWGRPVGYRLLHEEGYIVYPGSLAIRSDRLDAEAPCLEKLVPIIQQAGIDYLTDPVGTNEVIVEIVDEYNTGWVYSAGVADYGASTLLELGLVEDSPDGTYGSFDLERIEENIDLFGTILADAGGNIADDLSADELVTNEFIDPALSLVAAGSGD